ncbi:MAG: hypothetical protein ACW974_08270 [Candidatus Thorarchaeota archaeon]
MAENRTNAILIDYKGKRVRRFDWEKSRQLRYQYYFIDLTHS